MTLVFSIWQIFGFFPSFLQWRKKIHLTSSREIQTRGQTSWSFWNYVQSPIIETKPFPCEQLVTGRPLTFCLFCAGSFCPGVWTVHQQWEAVCGLLLLQPPRSPGRQTPGWHRQNTWPRCAQVCSSQQLSSPSAHTKCHSTHSFSAEQDQLSAVSALFCAPRLPEHPGLSRPTAPTLLTHRTGLQQVPFMLLVSSLD